MLTYFWKAARRYGRPINFTPVIIKKHGQSVHRIFSPVPVAKSSFTSNAVRCGAEWHRTSTHLRRMLCGVMRYCAAQRNSPQRIWCEWTWRRVLTLIPCRVAAEKLPRRAWGEGVHEGACESPAATIIDTALTARCRPNAHLLVYRFKRPASSSSSRLVVVIERLIS